MKVNKKIIWDVLIDYFISGVAVNVAFYVYNKFIADFNYIPKAGKGPFVIVLSGVVVYSFIVMRVLFKVFESILAKRINKNLYYFIPLIIYVIVYILLIQFIKVPFQRAKIVLEIYLLFLTLFTIICRIIEIKIVLKYKLILTNKIQNILTNLNNRKPSEWFWITFGILILLPSLMLLIGQESYIEQISITAFSFLIAAVIVEVITLQNNIY